MVRSMLLGLLVAGAEASRVHVHEQEDLGAQIGALVATGLSLEEATQAHRAMEVLESLKIDSSDAKLQDEYESLMGYTQWAEEELHITKGDLQTFPGGGPPTLGETSSPGSKFVLAEMLSGNDESWFTTRLGRFFTGRRDFAMEPEVGGETKYFVDGTGLSMHSRMHISRPGDRPMYVVRRAFNYANPIARTVGQYMYRIIRCQDESGGWSGGCREGDYLYTITKDRLGRGALWGRDEWRVFSGDGGCRRHGYGVLWCNQKDQVMYSLSAGLTSGEYATEYYGGNIVALSGDGKSGTLFGGNQIDEVDISHLKVASASKLHGSPRWLNWPLWFGGAHAENMATEANMATTIFVNSLDQIQYESWMRGHRFAHALQLSPHQQALFNQMESAFAASSHATQMVQGLAVIYHAAKSLIWADSYSIHFEEATDEVMVMTMAAVQDLSREDIALRPAMR